MKKDDSMRRRGRFEKEWVSLFTDEVGTIYYDHVIKGIRCTIRRGPASLCAYIGIPLDHPLANRHYDNLPLNVHGGLTFAGTGISDPTLYHRGPSGVMIRTKFKQSGWYYYGWDYAHVGDSPLYITTYFHTLKYGKKWTVRRVKREIRRAARQVAALMNLRGYKSDASKT
jgi:hypothetical protein